MTARDPHSIRSRVFAIVQALRTANADDVVPLLPDVDRRLIACTLNDLKKTNRLTVVVPSRFLGKGKGRTLATYALAGSEEAIAALPPKAKPVEIRRIPTSVFDLGRF